MGQKNRKAISFFFPSASSSKRPRLPFFQETSDRLRTALNAIPAIRSARSRWRILICEQDMGHAPASGDLHTSMTLVNLYQADARCSISASDGCGIKERAPMLPRWPTPRHCGCPVGGDDLGLLIAAPVIIRGELRAPLPS